MSGIEQAVAIREADFIFMPGRNEALQQTTRSRAILAVGILLSAALIARSLAVVPFGGFSAGLHTVMFFMLNLPFAALYFMSGNRGSSLSISVLTGLFSLCHIALIYWAYTTRPREFGYAGLVFAPFLEAAVAIPAGIAITWMLKRSER